MKALSKIVFRENNMPRAEARMLPERFEGAEPLPVDNRHLFEVDESTRHAIGDIHALTMIEGLAKRSLVTGYQDVTNDDLETEVFLPTASAHLISKSVAVKPIESLTGTIARLQLTEERDATGASETNEIKIALVDEAYMPGYLGMQADQRIAQSEGRASIYDLYVDTNEDDEERVARRGINPDEDTVINGRNNDAYCIWELDTDRQRFDGKLGEWVLKSVLSSDAAASDVYVIKATPVPGRRAGLDSFTYDKFFLNSLSVDTSKDGENPYALSDKLLASKNRIIIAAVTKSLLDPTYDFRKRGKSGKSGKSLSLSSSEKDQVAELLRHIEAHEGSYMEPARAFYRAHFLMDELEQLEAERGRKSKAGYREQKQKIMHSFQIAGATIVNFNQSLIQDRARIARHQESKHVGSMSSSARFEAVCLDDIDMYVADRLYSVIGVEDSLQNVRQQLLQHVLGNERDRETTLAIRATSGQTKFRVFSDLQEGNRAAEERQFIAYNGQQMPYVAQGNYMAHELVSSAVKPLQTSVFPAGGNIFPGVVAAFEVVIEEEQFDAKKPKPSRFLVTSMAEQPFKLTTAVAQALNEKNLGKRQRMIFDGELCLTQIMASPHEQTVRIVLQDGNDLEIDPRRLRNGSALAVAVDAKHNFYLDEGRIKGQKPKTRQLGQARQRRTKSGSLSVEYSDRTTGKLPTQIETTDADNQPVREILVRDNIAFELLLAHGAVFMRNPGKKHVAVQIGHLGGKTVDLKSGRK